MRANRQLRRQRGGKSDSTDAEAAARAAASGQAGAIPKSGDGPVECIRMLPAVCGSAVKARTQAANQIHALVVTAPEVVKHQLRGLNLGARVRVSARLRPGPARTTVAYAKKTLRHLARRYRTLDTEITQLKDDIRDLCADANPALLAAPGVGPDTAAALLVTAGNNPERMKSETLLRGAVRCQPRPGVIRTNHPASTQPGRQPPSQPRPMAHRHHPHAHRPHHPSLRRTAPGRRKNHPRDHPLPQTAHHPRNLPAPHQPTPNPQLRPAA